MKLELTTEQVNQILNVLAQQPYIQVHELIATIQQQGSVQLHENQQHEIAEEMEPVANGKSKG